MKTLKFMLAAATAIGLASATQADQYNTTGFEKLTVGDPVTTGVEDNRTGYSYFYYAGATAEDNESVIAAGTPDIARPTGAADVDATRNNILQVSTGTDPLLRTYKPLSGSAPQAATELSGDTYVDTLVQFTVTPYTDTVTPGASDKLMIYLKESVTTNELGEITDASTNLVVVGGYYSAGATTAREYVLDTGSVTVNPNEWHRLTVKAVCDISDSLALGFPGFAIWIDGEACTLDYYTLDENDPSSIGPTVIAANADVLAKKLVLSLLTGSGMQTASLQAVGFAGEGKVDDIVFSDVDPFFTAVDFTFAGVSGVTATRAPGTDNWTFTAPEGSVISSILVNGNPVAFTAGATSVDWTAASENAGALVIVAAGKQLTAATHPWYESPFAKVLKSNLPGQTGNIVSAFHGQGQDEYLGLTYSTNPLQFDLFEVDGKAVSNEIYQVLASDVTTPGFRGVAISKALGIAMTLAYEASATVYAYPLKAGDDPIAVTKSSTHAFDAGAFSPDGKYFFSNYVKGGGETSNQYYVKWSVAVTTNSVTLTKVGSIDAGGRGRSLAYARINGRDLVFGLVDTGKIAVIDMTGDDTSAWSAADLVTGLPAHSYGTLCVSGVNATGATPKLTVATSTNNGATKVDVLNVYALTVPASGAVTQTLLKSFDEDALTAANFGDISDANRYGNTVYVTDDDKTIYFARPDNKLYAAEYALVGNATTGDGYETLQAAVDGATAGDTIVTLADCTISTSLSIAKNLTVHNDYTITGAVNYAICIGATVSFEGSGKIERASGITGSAFCVGANETTRGAITAGTAGTLNFDGLTVCGGSGGNLIKLENGTVNMNGGVLKDGLRGIKADADAGSYTSAIVINGGTITNCSACAVMASAQSATGTATVTINGGVIAGALAIDKKVGTYSITIPGTSTAKFDADQSAFCESGYETTLVDGWYVVTEKQTGWVDDPTTIPANTSVADQYPALAGSVLATADAKEVTEWAATNNVDFAAVEAATSGDTFVEAYLLNCEPVAATVADEKDEFVLDISVAADGTVTVSLPEGKKYNGTIKLKGKAALTDATWADVPNNTPSSSYKFYKYELSL